MNLVPLTTCCLWLNVDRKTLRLWLSTSPFSCCLHPTDARLRCLTLSDLQQLALLHRRHLPVPLPDCPAYAELAFPLSAQEHEVSVQQQLHLLAQQVTALHAQVADLALTLGHLTAVSCLVPVAPVPLVSSPLFLALPPSPRRQALPLIQVRPDGSVVIISPSQGVLGLLPDSPEWFSWLSGLTAFSFEGTHAHFSAARLRRHKQWTHGWNVRRSLHGRACSVYLGLDPTLTLAHLQAIATSVHARLTSH